MNTFFKLSLLFLCVLITSCSDSNEQEVEETGNNNTETETVSIETEILRLINEHRNSKNLSTLEISEIIKSQTDAHTDYMIAKGEISHDNFGDRSDYLKANDDAKSMAENVAIGYSSAKSVVNGWLNSEGHRKNIEGNYTHFNVTAKQNNGGTWYYTNIFTRK